MHQDHNVFLACIHSKNKVTVIFYAKDDGSRRLRTCAPMDYGPSRRAKDGADRYHLWDYDGSAKNHTISLLPEQLVSIQRCEEQFDPVEFVTWDTKKSLWFVPREWGAWS